MLRIFKFSKPLFLIALMGGVCMVYLGHVLLKREMSWSLAAGLVIIVLSYGGLSFIKDVIRKALDSFIGFIDAIEVEMLLGGIAGLIMGMLVGFLSMYPLTMLKGLGGYATLLVFFGSTLMGLLIGSRRANDVLRLLPLEIAGSKKPVNTHPPVNHKVLDTSAIIDGRIYDVCTSHFLDGCIIVPTFVIEELQHIADSSDNLRRNKGRRGLELLSKMQKHPDIKIDIIDTNIPDEKDVDSKLISLCKQLQASIITNDYNLNKVAEVQGIKVLNINELTNAVKMIVYPGEHMHISIIKEGKEPGQGVGYLEDGTMVVVEDAHDELGRELEVVVTSVFQTAAGRMIFTRKQKEETVHSNLNSTVLGGQEVNLYG